VRFLQAQKSFSTQVIIPKAQRSHEADLGGKRAKKWVFYYCNYFTSRTSQQSSNVVGVEECLLKVCGSMYACLSCIESFFQNASAKDMKQKLQKKENI
jgi:hypothetical protein